MDGVAYKQAPGVWRSVGWALRSPPGGGTSRTRLAARAVWASLRHHEALKRWMAVAFEQHSRGLASDLPALFLRALRPYVHRGQSARDRTVQLTDHVDWLESALQPAPLRQLASGQTVVLANLAAPRGYAHMRLELQRAPAHSPEGELLLSLTLQRDDSIKVMQPVDVAAVAFSVFRVQGKACLAIGGVRGQRHPVLRLSPVEITQALQGWKAPVLMLRVMQELASFWELHLIGLDPAWHPVQGWDYLLSKRHKEIARRIAESYTVLWEHFDAQRGPTGWVVLPPHSDDRLAATALSPEKRARQIQRADYWIRTGNQLRTEFRNVLQRPDPHARLGRLTESQTLQGHFSGYDTRQHGDEPQYPSVLESAPVSLL
ncbi:MAG: DUF535 family protein [Ramlibacter sp.]|nr:DUF535 family protein [Ramlibacter sp.]MBX3660484.1 DUF535 family protein [Ramlibacter sp.]MCW5652086.1 DUF535 family protein [Ramlibacter sp.]